MGKFRGGYRSSGQKYRSAAYAARGRNFAANRPSTTSRAGYRRYNLRSALNARTGGLLGIEKKFVDCAVGAVITAPTAATGGEFPPGSGITGCYTAPAQGDGPSNRDGNKIVVCEINCIGTIVVPAQINQTTADDSCVVYMALVQDTQTNGAQLNSEDVFSNPSGNAFNAANPLRNMSYTSRFKLLAIKKKQLRIPTLTYDGTNIEQTGFHSPIQLKWKGKIPVTFTTASTTADIANVTDNSVQLVGFCSNASMIPAFYGNVRTRFYG